eukprot:3965589-Prorocentrum_lima.AAC.1
MHLSSDGMCSSIMGTIEGSLDGTVRIPTCATFPCQGGIGQLEVPMHQAAPQAAVADVEAFLPTV